MRRAGIVLVRMSQFSVVVFCYLDGIVALALWQFKGRRSNGRCRFDPRQQTFKEDYVLFSAGEQKYAATSQSAHSALVVVWYVSNAEPTRLSLLCAG